MGKSTAYVISLLIVYLLLFRPVSVQSTTISAGQDKAGQPKENGVPAEEDTEVLKGETPYTKYYQQNTDPTILHGQVCIP